MALKKSTLKEILSKAGCEADQIDDAVQKILDGHVASIEALTDERDSLKAELEQAKADQKELADLKKNSGDLEELRKEYDDFKASVEAEKTRGKKESAFKVILKDCGIPEKHWAKIIKYSDVDGIELDAFRLNTKLYSRYEIAKFYTKGLSDRESMKSGAITRKQQQSPALQLQLRL